MPAFGRALRLMLSKGGRGRDAHLTDEQRRAAIAASESPSQSSLTTSNNVIRHGLPDARREWSLDRRERRSGKIGRHPNAGLRQPNASNHMNGFYVLPYCGHYPPRRRSAPEFVDGDLTELDAETLAAFARGNCPH